MTDSTIPVKSVDKTYISFEGNIGSGKSTFVNLIRESETFKKCCKSFVTLNEPIDQWLKMTDDKGTNILAYFYQDIPRWAYTFQMNAFITRSKQVHNAHKSGANIILGERSVLTDRNCFALNCAKKDQINSMEWKLYNEWYCWLTKDGPCKSIIPNIHVYLRTDPETAYERIKKRDRSEESSVPLEYIREIHKFHDDWLLSKPPDDKRVLIIDANEDFEMDKERFETILEKLISFIQSVDNQNK